MSTKPKIGLTSTALHLLAMALMLCDHLWQIGVVSYGIANCIGRLSFPVFAFLLVEGYFHTRNIKKYALRMFAFAVVSEIPFNLLVSGKMFYPTHQNVLWTLLLSLAVIYIIEKVKGKPLPIRIATSVGTLMAGCVIAIVTLSDYHCAGILTVLVFYFFRTKNAQNLVMQVLCLCFINAGLIDGFIYEISLGQSVILFPRQCFAVLGLLPIWLYNGERGVNNKFLHYACYAFYPIHLLILGLINIIWP